MKVVVGFLCPDGAVLAADSMLTPSIGTNAGMLPVGHHTGRKVYQLPGQQIFGWAGDLGLAARFKTMVELTPASAGMPAPPGAPAGPRPPFGTPLDYGLMLSGSI